MKPEIDHTFLREVLIELVRIDSRSTAQGGCEGALQRRVAEHFRDCGARPRRVNVDDVPEFRTHPLCHGPDRQYADRPTIIAEIGPDDAPALLVAAHADTVPIFAPEQWTLDPFGGAQRDGAIYGLGVSDDKWGVATILAIARALRGYPLKRKLIFASTIDEENGVGNGMLLLMLAGAKAEAALYLDGQSMDVLRGGLGGSNLYLRRRDGAPVRPAHIAALDQAARRLCEDRQALFDQPGYDDNLMRDRSVLVGVRDDDAGAARVAFYQVPGESRAGLQAKLEQMVAGALGRDADEHQVSYREPWFEPALVEASHPMVRHTAAAVRDVLGREARITTVSKQDTFVLINHAGIPTVSFGCTSRNTGRGAYHCPDEYLTLDELAAGATIAHRAVLNWLEDG